MSSWQDECERGGVLRDLSASVRATLPPLGALSRAVENPDRGLPGADFQCELPSLRLAVGADQQRVLLRLAAAAAQRAAAAQYNDLRGTLLGAAAAARVRRMGSAVPGTRTWHCAAAAARWHFACAAVRRRVKRETDAWSLRALGERRRMRLEYVAEYARVLAGKLAEGESAALAKLDTELSTSDIILFRSQAMRRVRIEADAEAAAKADETKTVETDADVETESSEAAPSPDKEKDFGQQQQQQQRTWLGWLAAKVTPHRSAADRTEVRHRIRRQMRDS